MKKRPTESTALTAERAGYIDRAHALVREAWCAGQRPDHAKEPASDPQAIAAEIEGLSRPVVR